MGYCMIARAFEKAWYRSIRNLWNSSVRDRTKNWRKRDGDPKAYEGYKSSPDMSAVERIVAVVIKQRSACKDSRELDSRVAIKGRSALAWMWDAEELVAALHSVQMVLAGLGGVLDVRKENECSVGDTLRCG